MNDYVEIKISLKILSKNSNQDLLSELKSFWREYLLSFFTKSVAERLKRSNYEITGDVGIIKMKELETKAKAVRDIIEDDFADVKLDIFKDWKEVITSFNVNNPQIEICSPFDDLIAKLPELEGIF